MMDYPEIISVKSDPLLTGLAEMLRSVAYTTASMAGQELCLLLPWRRKADQPRFPLIVFIQGSGWTAPNIGYELPQLASYAQNGYAVATVSHRNSLEGHPFPAFLQDVKTAIRFLRSHADDYHIDPDRVCVWGTSSGGNTALLIALTGDDPAYKTADYPDVSDSVTLAVECFGPTNLTMFTEKIAKEHNNDVFPALAGGRDFASTMREMSPLFKARAGMVCPPILLLHGDSDDVVPFEQGETMYRRLIECGLRAQMVRVIGAPHEGSFWSREVRDIISAYISKNL
jgi:acetyl esterase/lipase